MKATGERGGGVGEAKRAHCASITVRGLNDGADGSQLKLGRARERQTHALHRAPEIYPSAFTNGTQALVKSKTTNNLS